jgi:hypothetical protein
VKSFLFVFIASIIGFDASACGLLTNNQFDEIVSLIQKNKISSTQGLLTQMKSDSCFVDMFKNPILNPLSFALHGELVSPEFPRIVLFKPGLTFMFVGNPAVPASQLLEVISFNQKTATFQFSLINFNTPDKSLEFMADAAKVDFFALEKTDPTFSGLMACSFCHAMEATESRPRWGTPPLYQTPFGAANEQIFKGSRQYDQWQVFQKTLGDPAKNALYRFLEIETRADADGNIMFPKKPNSSLTLELEDRNLDRVARILRTAPGYAKKKFALAGVLRGEFNIRPYFTDEEWHQRLDQVRNSLRRSIDSDRLKLLDDVAFVEGVTQDTTAQNRMSLRTILDRVERPINTTAHFDLTGIVFDGQKLSQLPSEDDVVSAILKPEQQTEQTLNAIRLLFDGDMSENADAWSTSKSSPFGDSYRFTPEFLGRLLQQYVQPDLKL